MQCDASTSYTMATSSVAAPANPQIPRRSLANDVDHGVSVIINERIVSVLEVAD